MIPIALKIAPPNGQPAAATEAVPGSPIAAQSAAFEGTLVDLMTSAHAELNQFRPQEQATTGLNAVRSGTVRDEGRQFPRLWHTVAKVDTSHAGHPINDEASEDGPDFQDGSATQSAMATVKHDLPVQSTALQTYVIDPPMDARAAAVDQAITDVQAPSPGTMSRSSHARPSLASGTPQPSDWSDQIAVEKRIFDQATAPDIKPQTPLGVSGSLVVETFHAPAQMSQASQVSVSSQPLIASEASLVAVRGAQTKSLTIELSPRDLGNIEVKIRIVEGQAIVDIRATEQSTAHRLQVSEHEIRNALETGGLLVETISVRAMNSDASTTRLMQPSNDQSSTLFAQQDPAPADSGNGSQKHSQNNQRQSPRETMAPPAETIQNVRLDDLNGILRHAIYV